MISVRLSETQNSPEKLLAVERYCQKNSKLIALRDSNNRILSIGLSLKALQSSISKDGFKQFNVIYDKRKVIIYPENCNPEEYETLKSNNFLETYISYDCIVAAYDGKIAHEDEKANKMEDYWYRCYVYFMNNKRRFIPNDLINIKAKDFD